ncbi:MAG: DUF167 domain-containing protein [Burkholderiaceae bacterium]
MPVITLYIQPGAKQSRVVGLHDGLPKIAIKARPIDGEANEALITFLAELGGVPKRSIEILSGQTSRTKRVLIPDVVSKHLERLLASSD